MQYHPAVRIIRIPCTGRFDITHAMRAFQLGADAVMVAGCKVGECAYESGNLRAEERVKLAKELLDEYGLGGDRIEMFFMSAADADKFVKAANEMVERVKKLGPNPLKNQ